MNIQNIGVSDSSIRDTVNVFKLLSDETRIKILISILDEGKSVNSIVSEINASQSLVSHQLKLLKEMHMVKSERNGKCMFYSLDDEHVKSLLTQTIIHASEDHND